MDFREIFENGCTGLDARDNRLYFRNAPSYAVVPC